MAHVLIIVLSIEQEIHAWWWSYMDHDVMLQIVYLAIQKRSTDWRYPINTEITYLFEWYKYRKERSRVHILVYILGRKNGSKVGTVAVLRIAMYVKALYFVSRLFDWGRLEKTKTKTKKRIGRYKQEQYFTKQKLAKIR